MKREFLSDLRNNLSCLNSDRKVKRCNFWQCIYHVCDKVTINNIPTGSKLRHEPSGEYVSIKKNPGRLSIVYSTKF